MPSAKIAAILVDNEPYLLETGIYYIRSNNFSIIKKQLANGTMDFFDSTDPDIQCGAKLRLAPKPNTVAVYQEDGEYKIFDPSSASSSNEKSPLPKGCLIITNPNVKFVTSLKTDLINKNYPADKE